MDGLDQTITVLMADDDPDDCLLVREALEETGTVKAIHCVADGQQLLDYLRRRGKYAPPAEAPRPDLILLDLNMPKVDGRQALQEIRAEPSLRGIPVVALTNTDDPAEMQSVYNLGAQLYVTKPVTSTRVRELTGCLAKYWQQGV
jgi:CheY-like chemotaxis protein